MRSWVAVGRTAGQDADKVGRDKKSQLLEDGGAAARDRHGDDADDCARLCHRPRCPGRAVATAPGKPSDSRSAPADAASAARLLIGAALARFEKEIVSAMRRYVA